jgi:hypothetical protein
MKHKTLAIVALLVAVLLVVGFTMRPAPAQWEYQVLALKMTDASLNLIGSNGWELIAVHTDESGQTRFYFKRAK